MIKSQNGLTVLKACLYNFREKNLKFQTVNEDLFAQLWKGALDFGTVKLIYTFLSSIIL